VTLSTLQCAQCASWTTYHSPAVDPPCPVYEAEEAA